MVSRCFQILLLEFARLQDLCFCGSVHRDEQEKLQALYSFFYTLIFLLLVWAWRLLFKIRTEDQGFSLPTNLSFPDKNPITLLMFLSTDSSVFKKFMYRMISFCLDGDSLVNA